MPTYYEPEIPVPVFDLGVLPMSLADVRPTSVPSCALHSRRDTHWPRQSTSSSTRATAINSSSTSTRTSPSSNSSNNARSAVVAGYAHPASPSAVPKKRKSNRRAAAPSHGHLRKNKNKK